MKYSTKSLMLSVMASLLLLVNCGYANEPKNEPGPVSEAQRQWTSCEEQIKRGMKPEVAREALNIAATLLPTDRDPLDILLRRLPPLVEHLESLDEELDLAKQKSDLDSLRHSADAIPVEQKEQRRLLFDRAIKLQREIALKNPLLDFTDILFIKRHACEAKNSQGEFADERGNHMCDQYFGFNALPGGGLCVLTDAFGEHPKVIDLLQGKKIEAGADQGKTFGPDWGYLSPELSWNQNEIFWAATRTDTPRFACKWTADNCFHVFKAKYDAKTRTVSQPVQLTDGAFNDFDPCLLPSGRIAFISERRLGYGRCHPRVVPTYTLHTMNADGSDIVTVSMHETNEWQPIVDQNGMIVYTRWDYVDRGALNAHHPWITSPDGCDPRAIQGNYIKSVKGLPIMEMNIQIVPQTNKLTATAAAHHGQAYGSLLLIDPRTEDDDAMAAVRRITPEVPFPESESEIHVCPCDYATCMPLSDYFYLCAYDPFSNAAKGPNNSYGLYLLDAFGNKVLLYRDEKISCLDPIPVRTRECPPVVPHKTLVGKPLAPGEKFVPVDPKTLPKTAEVGLVNVYDTKLTFPANTKIKKLRIVQVLPKTTPLESDPWIGYGHQKGARSVLGTVPVEEDGSAFFTLPVNTPVYFQALDEKGVAIASMRSDTYVHEGEKLICQGCHENRHSTSANMNRANVMAMRRPASTLKPDPMGTQPMNFPLLIQPILDQKCVQCHAESKDPKAIDLSRGPKENHFFNSFNHLKPFCFYYNNYYWTEPKTIPGQFGSLASPLYRLLTSDHYGLKLTPEELYRFTVWMDNNCDFYGTYENCPEQKEGKVVQPTLR